MEIIGIICEYSPFHNGHVYHLKKIKELYPESIIILVINGYFLERGEISLISKYDKTLVALENNVDIVLELPVLFGTQSADTFAYTAVKILNEFKVNRIIFGSESNDINAIKNIASKSLENTYSPEIKKLLDEGINYPTALAKSLKTSFNFLPNDLLGISYVKSILQINNNIVSETIQRTNDYLDTVSNNSIISASNIRNKLALNENISEYLPSSALAKINNINYVLYFNIIKGIILQNNNLDAILDVDEGMENRLYEGISKTNNLKDFIEFLKTKRYTYNRINRMLIHIILGIKKCDAKNQLEYINVLGFNKIGEKYLNSIKKDMSLSITKNKKSIINIYEAKASLVYDMLTNQNTYTLELKNKPIIK